MDSDRDARPPTAAPRSRTHHDLLRGDTPLEAAAARRRDLKHRLADVVRRIAEATQLVDAVEVDENELADVVEAAERLADRLDATPSLRRHGTISGSPGWQSALMERSPISGVSNPIAAPLFLAPDGDVLRGHATYGLAYEGPVDSLHGGMVAAAFDEVVGVAQKLSGQSGMTGTLTVRMRRPTPLHTRIEYEGHVERIEGRKIFVEAHSTANGEVLCAAEAVMIIPRDRLAR